MKKAKIHAILGTDDVLYRTQDGGYAIGPDTDEGAKTDRNYLNNRAKYVKKEDLSSIELAQLEAFPESHDLSYTVYITNIGLIAFCNESETVVYDILQKEPVDLAGVGFSLDPFDSYSDLLTPLSHYFVEYSVGEQGAVSFPIQKAYSDGGKLYYKAPVDYINGVMPEKTGLFELTAETPALTALEYTYSQGLRLRQLYPVGELSVSVSIVSADGTETVGSYTLPVNGALDIDLSNYPNGGIIRLGMDADSAESGSGLLEVLC